MGFRARYILLVIIVLALSAVFLTVNPRIQALFGASSISQSNVLKFGAPQENEYVAMASTEDALPVRYSLSDEGYLQRLTYPQILSDAKFVVKSHSGEAERAFVLEAPVEAGESSITPLEPKGYILEFKDKPTLQYETERKDEIKGGEEEVKKLTKEYEDIKIEGWNIINPFAWASKIGKGSQLSNAEASYRNLEENFITDVEDYKRMILSSHENFKRKLELEGFPVTGMVTGKGAESRPEKILGEYEKVFNGIALDISETEAERLKDFPEVKEIYPNMPVNMTLYGSVPLINADDVWKLQDSEGRNVTGQNTTIAIIDTGIDYTHPDLGGEACLIYGAPTNEDWCDIDGFCSYLSEDLALGENITVTYAGETHTINFFAVSDDGSLVYLEFDSESDPVVREMEEGETFILGIMPVHLERIDFISTTETNITLIIGESPEDCPSDCAENGGEDGCKILRDYEIITENLLQLFTGYYDIDHQISMDSGRIAYYSGSTIYIYSFGTGERIEIDSLGGRVVMLALGDNLLAYVDYSDIYLYDLDTGVHKKISENVMSIDSILVSNGKVVYGREGAIYLYDVSDETETLVAQGGRIVNRPVVSGNLMAYLVFSTDTCYEKAVIYNMDTGEEQEVTPPDIGPVLDFSGDKILYVACSKTDFDWDWRTYYLYDINTGEYTNLSYSPEPGEGSEVAAKDISIISSWISKGAIGDGIIYFSKNINANEIVAYDQNLDRYVEINPSKISGAIDAEGNKVCFISGDLHVYCHDYDPDYDYPLPEPPFNSKVIGGYDFVNNDKNPIDDQGHGTHCAGIAAGNGVLKGVAPDAKLYAYKVLNSGGSGYWSWIIAGIERAVDPNQDGDFSDHVDVISMSLGGPGDPDDPVSQAVDRAVEAGVVAAISAGNSGPSPKTIGSPGTARKAITVGASNKYDDIAGFSSRGPVTWGNETISKPDVVAPGVSICAAQHGSAWESSKCYDDDHVAISGTSMAAPHVAGAAALLKQKNPDWGPDEIKTVLKSTAEDLGFDLFTQGSGRIDVLKAANSLKPPKIEMNISLDRQTEILTVDISITSENLSSYSLDQRPEFKDEWAVFETGSLDAQENSLNFQYDMTSLDNGPNLFRIGVNLDDGSYFYEIGTAYIDNFQITRAGNELNYMKEAEEPVHVQVLRGNYPSYEILLSRFEGGDYGEWESVHYSDQSLETGEIGIINTDAFEDGKYRIKIIADHTGGGKVESVPVYTIILKSLRGGMVAKTRFKQPRYLSVTNLEDENKEIVFLSDYRIELGGGWYRPIGNIEIWKDDSHYKTIGEMRKGSQIYPLICNGHMGYSVYDAGDRDNIVDNTRFYNDTEEYCTSLMGMLSDSTYMFNWPSYGKRGERAIANHGYPAIRDSDILFVSEYLNLSKIYEENYEEFLKSIENRIRVSDEYGNLLRIIKSRPFEDIEDVYGGIQWPALAFGEEKEIVLIEDVAIFTDTTTERVNVKTYDTTTGELKYSRKIFETGEGEAIRYYVSLSSGDLFKNGKTEIVLGLATVNETLYYEDIYNEKVYTSYIHILNSSGELKTPTITINGYMVMQTILTEQDGEMYIIALFSGTWTTSNYAIGVINSTGHLVKKIILPWGDSASKLLSGDIDNDGVTEILVSARPRFWEGEPSYVRIYDIFGNHERDIEIPTFYEVEYLNDFMLTDYNRDGKTDLVILTDSLLTQGGWVTAQDGKLYVFNLDSEYNPDAMYWPMFRHDPQRTGIYGYEMNVTNVTRELPDVAVSLENIMGEYAVNREYNITVKLENVGLNDTGEVNIALYDNQDIVSQKTTDSIPTGSERLINFTWIPKKYGSHEIEVLAETPNDMDTGNNLDKADVFVYEKLVDVSGHIDMDWSKPVKVGEEAEINVTIYNLGVKNATDTWAKLYDQLPNGTEVLVWEETIGNLEPGDSMVNHLKFALSWMPDEPGWHELRLIMNASNDEYQENNRQIYTVIVHLEVPDVKGYMSHKYRVLLGEEVNITIHVDNMGMAEAENTTAALYYTREGKADYKLIETFDLGKLSFGEGEEMNAFWEPEEKGYFTLKLLVNCTGDSDLSNNAYYSYLSVFEDIPDLYGYIGYGWDEKVLAGKEVNVSVVIMNLGVGKAKGTKAKLFYAKGYEWKNEDFILIDEVEIGNLSANSIKRFNISWTPGEKGDYVLKLVVNCTNGDSTYQNNINYDYIDVIPDAPDIRGYLREYFNYLPVNEESKINLTAKSVGSKTAKDVTVSMYYSKGRVFYAWGGSLVSGDENYVFVGKKELGELPVDGKKDLNFSWKPNETGYFTFKFVFNCTGDENFNNNELHWQVYVVPDAPDVRGEIWIGTLYSIVNESMRVQFEAENLGGQEARDINVSLYVRSPDNKKSLIFNEMVDNLSSVFEAYGGGGIPLPKSMSASPETEVGDQEQGASTESILEGISAPFYPYSPKNRKDFHVGWTPEEMGKYILELVVNCTDDFDPSDNIDTGEVKVTELTNITVRVTDSSGNFINNTAFGMFVPGWYVPTMFNLNVTNLTIPDMTGEDGSLVLFGYTKPGTYGYPQPENAIFFNNSKIKKEMSIVSEFYKERFEVVGALLHFVHAIDVSWDYSGAEILIDTNISEYNVQNESPLDIYSCPEWVFESRECKSAWTVLNTTQRYYYPFYFYANTSSIGAFGLGEFREIIPPKPQEPLVSFNWSEIWEGRTAIKNIDNPEIDVTRLSFRVRRRVSNVIFTIRKIPERPPGTKSVSGEAYKYFDVSHANIEDADVENVKIKFRVRKSWLNDNDIEKLTVSLNRYQENNWEKLETTKVSEDSSYVYYEAIPPGFSLFVITGMEISLVCNNNGICGPGENAGNCPNDCHCVSGETRSCAIGHYGICSSGVETCTNSRWTGCPSPQTETCNRRDDNCDGTVDDVNNGNSVSSTGCQCYNNAIPKGEECNGIDDNCNGVKDENLERTCGPDNIRGICRQGTSTCTNGQWSDCIGMVYPQQNELCGNNLDDNCNGMVDDGCETCYNSEQDGDEEGVDCGGSCQPCPMDLSWLVFIVIGVVVLLIVLLLFFAGAGKKEKEWDELMQKEMKREESI